MVPQNAPAPRRKTEGLISRSLWAEPDRARPPWAPTSAPRGLSTPETANTQSKKQVWALSSCLATAPGSLPGKQRQAFGTRRQVGEAAINLVCPGAQLDMGLVRRHRRLSPLPG